MQYVTYKNVASKIKKKLIFKIKKTKYNNYI